ncbi:MAG: hypothetical protein ACSHWU_09090 [Marinicella sp.]
MLNQIKSSNQEKTNQSVHLDRNSIFFISLISMLMSLSLFNSATASTVGPGSDCDFNDLYSAINAVPTNGSEIIQIIGNDIDDYVVTGNFNIISKNIQLHGGMIDCGIGNQNINDKTIIKRSLTTKPVLGVYANSNVTLYNIIIEDGSNDNGGGVAIHSGSHVTLNNSVIQNNMATINGGGVYVDEAKLTITANSVIANNNTEEDGGGVYCQNSEIRFVDGLINGNTTLQDDGGGMYLNNCQLSGTSGNSRVISNNISEHTGGGIYAENNSVINLGDSASETLIEGNKVRSNYAVGGGMYIKESIVNLTNAHVAHNTAHRGGGIFATLNSQVFVEQTPDNCVSSTDYFGCTSFENNTAKGYSYGDVIACLLSGGYGGAFFISESSLWTNGLIIKNNRSTRPDCVGGSVDNNARGPVVYAKDADVTFINALIYENGGERARDVFLIEDSHLMMVGSTVANNRVNVEATIRANGVNPNVEIWSSLFDEDLTDVFDHSGGADSQLNIHCVQTNNASDFTNGGVGTSNIEHLTEGNSRFINASGRNYRLRSDSDALDKCTLETMSENGLEALYNFDLTGGGRPIIATNALSPIDLGAFEYGADIGALPQHADLKVEFSGPSLLTTTNSIDYSVSARNFSGVTAQQVRVEILLDDLIDADSVIFSPEIVGMWTCGRNNNLLTCYYNEHLESQRTTSSLLIELAPVIQNGIITTLASVDDVVSLDPNYTNNTAVVDTLIQTDSEDMIFSNGFE